MVLLSARHRDLTADVANGTPSFQYTFAEPLVLPQRAAATHVVQGQILNRSLDELPAAIVYDS
jgi:hypothetical protein